MRFENAPDSSHLAYCTISYSGNIFVGMGGILCTNSNPVITHCRISDNKARSSVPGIAGGIVLNNSNAEISWCDISNNGKPDYGGGIYISNSSPVITGCNISGNESVMYGGGIYITGNSSPIITSCTIEGNVSNWEGGGIYCAGGVTNFLECTIGYNESYLSGGGIYSATGNMSLNRCTIEHNQCSNWSGQGGGIFANGGTLMVDHCTIYGNYVPNWDEYGMDIHNAGSVAMTVSNSIFYNDVNFIVFGSTSPASVSYCDFQSDIGSYFTGNVPPGLGALTLTNTNGDSCDVFYNIYINPLFVDYVNADYHLTWSNWPVSDSTRSPAIDAGDPGSSHDRDGTITDMGAYYFNWNRPLIAVSNNLLDFGEVFIGTQSDTSLLLYNHGFDTLEIYSMMSSNEVFSTTFNPANAIILPEDSLEIIISFSPADEGLILDTLFVESNDKPFQVILQGTGKISTGIEEDLSAIPKEYALNHAYPNPFNPSTHIKFTLPKPGHVLIEVYNLLGQKIDILLNQEMLAGYHEIVFDAKNHPSAIYFYRIQAGDFQDVKKMALIK
jgi:hypothetical protein